MSALITGLLVLGGGSSAAAAVWNVTKTGDSADGACTPGLCSLRDAIVAANADSGDTINVPASASHYTLNEKAGVLEVTKPMTIIGAARARRSSTGPAKAGY